eukprot:TRINITY_DN1445_c1_g1_i1.p1 TRINITY_DN1445_c1_g1~~TRINITY_DN1445_c1_g1_i1.p1  ORF type:complete len:940 (-),score=270.28 TRINITY_DN1445_c1_g1_i1:73-2892(-)
MDRSVLNKATSADDIPTPGYLYTEIAKSTFADITACQQLADYLLKKLERDNPHVKLKVLKIIKHVCEQGKPDFRRAIQKKAELVKACLQYRGTPDPLKGDAPNKAVREEADVAVKAVFSSDSSTNAYGIPTSTGQKMQGFGSEGPGGDDMSGRIGGMGGPSNSFGGGGGNSSFGSSSFGSSSFGGGGCGGAKSMGSGGMVGFGNPNFDNAPKEDKETAFKQAMSTAMSSTFSAVSRLSAKVSGAPAPAPSSGPDLSQGSTYRPPTAGGAGFSSGGGGGGGYGGNSGSNGGFGSNQAAGGRWGATSGNSACGGGGGSRPAVSSSSTGEYEARVVAELCAPGGARVAPSAAALEEFCKKAESLDATAVGNQLRQKLSAPDWQTRLKALHAVEALHQHELDAITGHVSQFSSEMLFECQQMPQCRQKALKVLHLLGFIEKPEDGPGRPNTRAEVAQAGSQPAEPVDLLGFDDVTPSVSQQAPAQVPGAGDLLLQDGGDLLQAAPPVANGVNGSACSVGSMLDFGAPAPGPSMSEAAPLAGSPADGGCGEDLFGNLSMHAPPDNQSSFVPLQQAAPLMMQAAEPLPCTAVPMQQQQHQPLLGGGMLQQQQQQPQTASEETAETLCFPVEVADGRSLQIAWTRGEDPLQVALGFAREHGIQDDEVPAIVEFIRNAENATSKEAYEAEEPEKKDEESKAQSEVSKEETEDSKIPVESEVQAESHACAPEDGTLLFSFPIALDDGRELRMHWQSGDDLIEVALAFAKQHGIPEEMVPEVVHFAEQLQSSAKEAPVEQAAHENAKPDSNFAEELQSSVKAAHENAKPDSNFAEQRQSPAEEASHEIAKPDSNFAEQLQSPAEEASVEQAIHENAKPHSNFAGQRQSPAQEAPVEQATHENAKPDSNMLLQQLKDMGFANLTDAVLEDFLSSNENDLNRVVETLLLYR